VRTLWEAEGRTLRDLVATTHGNAQGEVLFRLGEWERDSADRVRRDMESGVTSDATGEADIRRHLDASEAALLQAQRLAATDRVPQVLFALGDVRRSRGNAAGAAEPFSALVKSFPRHPLAVDAAIALGDDAFDAGHLADAINRYHFADVHAPGAGARAYARYKLAWCRLNLEEYGNARKLLLDVVALARTDARRLSLADEARRDFVLALARDPTVTASDAQASIVRLGLPPDRTRRYEEGYASIIAGAGRDAEATQVLASLEDGAPAGEAASIFTAELDIAVRQRDLPGSVLAGRKLSDALSVASRAPATSGGSKPAVPAAAGEAAEHALRVAAVTLHGEGRARGDARLLSGALQLYDDYFQVFDSAAAAYELHHHAGELFTLLHKPALAERHYTAAVERDLVRLSKHEAPGKWLEASALGAVNAALDAMPAASNPPRASGSAEEDVNRPPPPVTPLTPPEQILVAASDRYLRALPGGVQAIDIAYQRALVLYRHNRFREAEPVLRAIALDHPEHPAASFAAELSLDALRLQGQYEPLADLAVEFQGRRPLATKLGSELQDVHESALLAAAAREGARGHEREASRRYLDFAARFPASRKLDRALYNAAAALTVEGRLSEAIHARDRLLRDLPHSPLLSRAREQQLADLLRLGRFSDAERLASQIAGAGGPAAADRLHDAVAIAEAAGDLRAADMLREKYIREHAHGPDAMDYAIALADRARGCTAQEQAARRSVSIASDAAWRAVALDRLALREQKCQHEGAARMHAAEVVALSARISPRRADALDATADAARLLTLDEGTKYRKIPLAPPYERTLPKKLSALKSYDDHLAKVVARGRASAAICALVDSGSAYGDLAHDLSRARPPRSLTASQRDLFRETLAEKSQPLFDHARQTLMEAITRAREAGISPPCLSDARHELAALWPERFGPREEAVARLEAATQTLSLGPVEVLSRAPDAPAAWLVAGRAEILARHPQAAVVLADRVQRQDFLYPQAVELKAQAFDAMGQTDAALALWQELAHEYPDRPLAHQTLADRAIANGDFEAARAHLLALRAQDARNADVALNLGVVLHALGDVAGAEKAWREAKAMAPGRIELSLDLGLLLCGDAGRPAEGIVSLEQFERAGGHAPDGKGFEAAMAACKALAKGAQP
jgi:tetratricopeptide (TPR) repeat protein